MFAMFRPSRFVNFAKICEIATKTFSCEQKPYGALNECSIRQRFAQKSTRNGIMFQLEQAGTTIAGNGLELRDFRWPIQTMGGIGMLRKLCTSTTSSGSDGTTVDADDASSTRGNKTIGSFIDVDRHGDTSVKAGDATHGNQQRRKYRRKAPQIKIQSLYTPTNRTSVRSKSRKEIIVPSDSDVSKAKAKDSPPDQVVNATIHLTGGILPSSERNTIESNKDKEEKDHPPLTRNNSNATDVHIDYNESKNFANLSLTNDVNPLLSNASNNTTGKPFDKSYPMIRKLIEGSQLDVESDKTAILNLLQQSDFTDDEWSNVKLRNDSDSVSVSDTAANIAAKTSIAADVLKTKAAMPSKRTLEDTNDSTEYKGKVVLDAKHTDIIPTRPEAPSTTRAKTIVNPESDEYDVPDRQLEQGKEATVKPKFQMILKSISASEIDNDLQANLTTPTKLHIDKTNMPIEKSKYVSKKITERKMSKEKLRKQLAATALLTEKVDEIEELKVKDLKSKEMSNAMRIDVLKPLKVASIDVKTHFSNEEQPTQETLAPKLLETTTGPDNLTKVVEGKWENVVKPNSLTSESALIATSPPVGVCKMHSGLPNAKIATSFAADNDDSQKDKDISKMDGPNKSPDNEKKTPKKSSLLRTFGYSLMTLFGSISAYLLFDFLSQVHYDFYRPVIVLNKFLYGMRLEDAVQERTLLDSEADNDVDDDADDDNKYSTGSDADDNTEATLDSRAE